MEKVTWVTAIWKRTNSVGVFARYVTQQFGDYGHVVPETLTADYVVWRKTGINGPTGYDTWRTHFGEPGGSGSGASANANAPEPSTLVMLVLAATGVCSRRRRAA
jgi:hypothetical protein